jgi:hypothetical protein
MNKVSRAIFRVGLFFATVALALGLSLAAMRVRAAVDARRVSTGVQVLALPELQAQALPAAQLVVDPALGTSQMPCVSDEDICDGPWGIEPASSQKAPEATAPASEQSGPVVRNCCGQIVTIPTAIVQEQASVAPTATPQYRANCH